MLRNCVRLFYVLYWEILTCCACANCEDFTNDFYFKIINFVYEKRSSLTKWIHKIRRKMCGIVFSKFWSRSFMSRNMCMKKSKHERKNTNERADLITKFETVESLSHVLDLQTICMILDFKIPAIMLNFHVPSFHILHDLFPTIQCYHFQFIIYSFRRIVLSHSFTII